MKKLLLLLIPLIIIIINGCQPPEPLEAIPDLQEPPIPKSVTCTTDDDCELGTCEDGSTYVKSSCSDNNECILINYIRDPCQNLEETKEEIVTVYQVGDEIIVGGETLTVKDITQDGEIFLEYDNKEISIKGTNDFTKVNTQEITISSFSLDSDLSKRFVSFVVEDIQLDENEYLLNYRREIQIGSKKVRLHDVDTDKVNTIVIKVIDGLNSDSKRINKGKTEEILGLKITNIRSNPRAISLEKYAIIKVE